MASSTHSYFTTLALTLILIFRLIPETTASRHLNGKNPAVIGVTTTSEKYIVPTPLPPFLRPFFPPLQFAAAPFGGNIPQPPLPSPPPTFLPCLPGFKFPPFQSRKPTPP
ncbi:hypothetical protein AtNW77_Chr1g0034201 [Arabidopsis thaliana]|uniref:At1g30795 n=5 Tax=Arabidopsis TaxID=3701 RepID=Q9SY21_ARATH|nr:Glycine-rich protein family [Arabidopsis thaliana]KAG7648080.1 hypothetical protein ISN45_At01g030590 [Arabidopsis thaliana x Arabidopsis arenosa]KAG7656002.1 hypothetical protein ISN44_As01g030250 [Arabidopsis suecica]AAD32932.1 T17H7.7 [Arabidopsis thaliana]AAM62710.1 unknown [Arabidopsis thaliana]ABE65675.1 hydroxyproline-rich glycoprotein family protein [Arabidopsis thaliana]|eukprot:NP_564363.1 Glycine-rich protein family [Arabidopsis thaliana]